MMNGDGDTHAGGAPSARVDGDRLTHTGADERARAAAAQAAVERCLRPGMTIGLGSGRAVAAVIDAVARRWPDGGGLRAVTASPRTAELAAQAAVELIELDGRLRLDLAIDGADEVDTHLDLLKGGGGALLREKIIAHAAARFVVVAEETKLVRRLGARRALPVEVVRFGWRQTRRRLLDLLPDAALRVDAAGEPLLTDEGHYILECPLPDTGDLRVLADAIKLVTGVVEHGLFLSTADEAFLGRRDGSIEVLRRTTE